MPYRVDSGSLAELLSVPLGDAAAGLRAEGVAFDSREVQGGELFIALPGENTHGHEFVRSAFERGAALALVEKQSLFSDLGAQEKSRIIEVPATLDAFHLIAGSWRRELSFPVLGITGSVGKTTVKEICGAMLLRHERGVYSERSFNNHVGLPYTICKAGPEHSWLVLEMGMNEADELRALTNIAHPDAAIITTVAEAHIENFPDGLAGIARAKCEILDGLPPGAPVVVPRNNQHLNRALQEHPRSAEFKKIVVGTESDCDSTYSSYRSNGFEGSSFSVRILGEEGQISWALTGEHNAYNAVLSLTACSLFYPEFKLERGIAALTDFISTNMRFEKIQLVNGAVVVNDAYNANPASFDAAIKAVADSGRAAAYVVGDMKELGGEAAALHRRVGEQIAESAPSFVLAVGEFAEELLAGAKRKGIACAEADTPREAGLLAAKKGFELLLVKGSRAGKLEEAVEAVIESCGGVALPEAASFKVQGK